MPPPEAGGAGPPPSADPERNLQQLLNGFSELFGQNSKKRVIPEEDASPSPALSPGEAGPSAPQQAPSGGAAPYRPPGLGASSLEGSKTRQPATHSAPYRAKGHAAPNGTAGGSAAGALPAGGRRRCAEEFTPFFAAALRYEGSCAGTCEAEMLRRFGVKPSYEKGVGSPPKTRVSWAFEHEDQYLVFEDLWRADKEWVSRYIKEYRDVLPAAASDQTRVIIGRGFNVTSVLWSEKEQVRFCVECRPDVDMADTLLCIRGQPGVCSATAKFWGCRKRGDRGEPHVRVYLTNLPDARGFEESVRSGRIRGVLRSSLAPPAIPTAKYPPKTTPPAAPAAPADTTVLQRVPEAQATARGVCFVCREVPSEAGPQLFDCGGAGFEFWCGDTVCRRCAGPWLRALAGEGGEVRCGACGECLGVAEVEAIAHGDDGLKAALKEASVRRCVAQGMAAACSTAGCRGILPKDSRCNICSECGTRQSTDA